MGQKRKEIPPPPPKAADRDEEEQSGDEEEESEEVELPVTKKAAVAEDESDDVVRSEGSDSESELEASPKPLASMPPASIRSKLPTAVVASVKGKAAGKKPVAETADGKKKPVAETKAEDKAGKTSKKKEGAAATEMGDKKTTGAADKSGEKLFERLYSEDDEIAMLEGMVEFKEETGKNAMDDMNDFYEFVKSKIHVAVSHKQFVHKVKRLKLRYDKNVLKGKSTFTKDHEQQLYNVSLQIWGSEMSIDGSPDAAVNGGLQSGKKQKKRYDASKANDQEVKVVPAKKKLQVDRDSSSALLCLTEMMKSQGGIGGGVSENFLKRGLHLVGDGVTTEYGAKWRNLLLGESEMYVRRVELVRELMKLVVDAVEAADQ